MDGALDPALRKEVGEAKAALARHGIVIMRGVENELEPAMMVAARDSMASSPGKLRRMDDDDLDEFMGRLRKAATKSARELAGLHTHLLAKLGTEYIGDLVKELDGIDQLFRWERVAKAAAPVSALLEEKGFGPVSMSGPRDVSDSFSVELEEKWPAAFRRFKGLAEEASKRLGEEATAPKGAGKGPKKKTRKR